MSDNTLPVTQPMLTLFKSINLRKKKRRKKLHCASLKEIYQDYAILPCYERACKRWPSLGVNKTNLTWRGRFDIFPTRSCDPNPLPLPPAAVEKEKK